MEAMDLRDELWMRIKRATRERGRFHSTVERDALHTRVMQYACEQYKALGFAQQVAYLMRPLSVCSIEIGEYMATDDGKTAFADAMRQICKPDYFVASVLVSEATAVNSDGPLHVIVGTLLAKESYYAKNIVVPIEDGELGAWMRLEGVGDGLFNWFS